MNKPLFIVVLITITLFTSCDSNKSAEPNKAPAYRKNLPDKETIEFDSIDISCVRIKDIKSNLMNECKDTVS